MKQFANSINFIMCVFWLTMSMAFATFGVPINIEPLVHFGSFSMAWMFLSKSQLFDK